MSHDLEASYAAAEVASQLLDKPENCFLNVPARADLSAYAAREGRNLWPHADGVIELGITGADPRRYSVAIEFKRLNEGLHGVLTAIGQAHAYLRKGYAGSIIVLPETYSGFDEVGAYVRDVLDLTSQTKAIGVYSYRPPDLARPSPFADKLILGRAFQVDANPPVPAAVAPTATETQWAHVREGSTDPDAFFKYLQAVKLLGGGGLPPKLPHVPASLAAAVQRLRPGADPFTYLSHATKDEMADRAWRYFWYAYVLTDEVIEPWTRLGGVYVPNEAPLKIEKSDGSGQKMFFAGRIDSIKNVTAANLNAGVISVDDALDRVARNYHNRAHSYREDIDSGAEHLGFVDSEGRLTDEGYRFVDACERTGDPNSGLPRVLFTSAALREGGLGAFLHYVYRLSEERFSADAMAFTKQVGGHIQFDIAAYLQWVELQMTDRLRVIKKVALRGGAARKPFQAELALLRGLDIVGSFRPGVGLVINWPKFQDALEFGRSSQYFN
jgi:hypothetical protein